MQDKLKKYHVALSFSNKDRNYVEEFAKLLIENKIDVFYDKNEESNLWGRNLPEYFSDIYGKKSQHVIIFISKNYITSDWTCLERRAALDKQFRERNDYILPVKIDDAEIPGLPNATGHIDARKVNPKQLCDIFIAKINKKNYTISNHKKIATYPLNVVGFLIMIFLFLFISNYLVAIGEFNPASISEHILIIMTIIIVNGFVVTFLWALIILLKG